MYPTREQAFALLAHFEQLAGRNIYEVVEKDTFDPKSLR